MKNIAPTIETERLVMRPWRPSDRTSFAAMNANDRVMEFMLKKLTREESDSLADRIKQHFEDRGFGLWAIEVRGGAEFIGFTGLSVPRFEAHFTPCVEVGWRLKTEYWGHGYATEAARAALRFGFETAGLEEIVSFTTVKNVRSRRVMEKVGLTRDPAGDFDHPLVPKDHPLLRHVLYRISRNDAYSLNPDSIQGNS